MIDEGDKIPDIQLATPSGGRMSLRSYVGRPLALYFYPKDDTSGCTREAQDFSRLKPEFDELGVELLGVSRDAPAKHQKFIDKYDLTVPLATDEDSTALEAFGVWVEKQLYGKKYMGDRPLDLPFRRTRHACPGVAQGARPRPRRRSTRSRSAAGRGLVLFALAPPVEQRRRQSGRPDADPDRDTDRPV